MPGLSSFGRFFVWHYAALSQYFSITPKRLPSDSTFRRLFEQLDFQCLSACFNQWASDQSAIAAGDWLAVDGKSIKDTVEQANSSYQNFVSVVSVYSQRQGVVAALQQFENAHQSEIKVVEMLLDKLKLKDVVFSFEALHAQKNAAISCCARQ